jgi:hypothetical protein
MPIKKGDFNSTYGSFRGRGLCNPHFVQSISNPKNAMKVGRGGHFWLALGVEIKIVYVLGHEILAWDNNEDIPCFGTLCNLRSILS